MKARPRTRNTGTMKRRATSAHTSATLTPSTPKRVKGAPKNAKDAAAAKRDAKNARARRRRAAESPAEARRLQRILMVPIFITVAT